MKLDRYWDLKAASPGLALRLKIKACKSCGKSVVSREDAIRAADFGIETCMCPDEYREGETR